MLALSKSIFKKLGWDTREKMEHLAERYGKSYRAMIRDLDRDDDGHVDEAEFTRWLSAEMRIAVIYGEKEADNLKYLFRYYGPSQHSMDDNIKANLDADLDRIRRGMY